MPEPYEGDETPHGLLRPTSTQQVADYIRRQIFEGNLKVGERVPQDEIAADLGVSRAPVREAIIALDREGWVMIQPHRGAFVIGLDENSTRDHAVHRKLQAATDPHEFSELNLEFMRRLVGIAASRRVSSTVRLMAVSIVPGDFFAGVPDAIRIHKRHLRSVMKALKAGDGESAEREVISMLRQEADLVVALLTQRGVIGSSADDPQ